MAIHEYFYHNTHGSESKDICFNSKIVINFTCDEPIIRYWFLTSIMSYYDTKDTIYVHNRLWATL